MDFHIWRSVWILGVPVLEKILRAMLIYIFLVVALRLAGKRELAQLNPFDLVVLLTISNTVQNAIIGEDNSVTGGIIGASTLLLVNYVVVRFLYSHPKLDAWVEGAPGVVIEGGRIREDRMKKELLTLQELETAAHKQGFTSLKEVDRAVLEPGGSISFIPKDPLPEDFRHQEVMKALKKLSEEVAALRSKSAS
ncbi:MAG: DUF421 domain-containing protein [bacterium]